MLVITIDTELLVAVPSSFVTPWTVARQVPLSVGFPRQEYWSELPFPTPKDLPNLEIEPVSPALAGRFFMTGPPGKPSFHQFLFLFKCGYKMFEMTRWFTVVMKNISVGQHRLETPRNSIKKEM